MRKGFSLLETILATSVLSLVLAVAMGSWMLFMTRSNRANVQSSLDQDARKVIERFRAEMRNASRETIIFYPEQQEPYKAVGFALASDSDGDGLMDMEAGGSNILWRQTVVYHVYDRSPTQMRRTVFSNRNSGAAYSDYYSQIGRVVQDGNGAAACLSGESVQTSVMFENLFTGKLWHAEAVFDAYASEANTLERTTFGSVALGPGEHTVTFTVKGKNPNSSGRRIRLDQLSTGVSGWPLEAELRTVSGSAAPFFVGMGLSGGAYGLAASTAADGESFSLKVLNDAIEECGFIGKGRNVAFSNTVVRFDTTYRPTGFDQGVYVTALDGQYTNSWWASEQAFDAVSGGRDPTPTDLLYKPGTNCVIRIPVLGGYVRQSGYGPVFRMYRSAYNANLKILNPAYAPTDTPSSPDISDGTALIPLEFYQNGINKATWAECAEGGVALCPAAGRQVPLNMGEDYILSFQLTVSTPNSDQIRAFKIEHDSDWGCWIIKGGDAALAQQRKWSDNPNLGYVQEKDSSSTWKRCLPALVNMSVGFAERGDYVSHPFDTGTASGVAKTFSWDADVPAGASLVLYARSGNTLTEDGFGIADAPEWASVSPATSGDAITGGTGRYLQFRGLFQSSTYTAYPGEVGGKAGKPYRNMTPRLRRAFITWAGDSKYVDIVGNMLKGPDCGMYKIDVDGKSMVRGVTMEIEIFKDVTTQGGIKKERLRSAMMAEIEPRNTKKK
jgi:type II secretory pathway pseudopilin PulG